MVHDDDDDDDACVVLFVGWHGNNAMEEPGIFFIVEINIYVFNIYIVCIHLCFGN
jgi:hypothetical protein